MYEDAFGGVRSEEKAEGENNRVGQTSRKGKGMKCWAHGVCVTAYVIIGTIFQGLFGFIVWCFISFEKFC